MSDPAACRGKIAYATQTAAYRVLHQLQTRGRKHRRWLHVYRCPVHGYHLGFEAQLCQRKRP